MGTSTLSGPIQAGTVRDGTIAGGKNLGRVELVQTYTVPVADILAAGQARTMMNIPAGSKILGMTVEVITVLATATNCAVIVGIVGTTNKYWTTFNTGTAVGMVTTATVAAAQQVALTDNIGTSDVALLVTTTAATADATTGSLCITIRYLQRNADGT